MLLRGMLRRNAYGTKNHNMHAFRRDINEVFEENELMLHIIAGGTGMNGKLNLIMPMGGGGTRFGNVGYESPKPLIDLFGKPFFYYATKSITDYVDVASLTFVVLRDHVNRFEIDKRILEYFPDAHIEVILEVLPGAVLTCMAGVKNLPEGEPVLFNDCDHAFVCNKFAEYAGALVGSDNNSGVAAENSACAEKLDGALLTFESDEDKFSYASFDENGYVNRTVEKEVISNDAICGAYYFKDKDTFLANAEEYLTKCQYKEFFMSGVYNVMCEHGLKIKTFRTDEHISFGTPDEYEEVLAEYEAKGGKLKHK